MGFHLYDRRQWPRSKYYDYYRNIIKTRYTLTDEIDVTQLLKQVNRRGLKFYPVFVHILMQAVNEQPEFRMALDGEKNPGYFDVCHPSYTVFHEDSHTFSDIWTYYDENFERFYAQMTKDIQDYGHIHEIKAKPGQPANFTSISCIPWLNYKAYAIDTYAESDMLFPIILFGRYENKNDRWVLPLSVSMNHAAADGWHVCQFINRVKELSEHWR